MATQGWHTQQDCGLILERLVDRIYLLRWQLGHAPRMPIEPEVREALHDHYNEADADCAADLDRALR